MENPIDEKKILNSFKNVGLENKFNFTIDNYDENYNKIQSLSKNNFEKLGQMQQLRVNFIQEIREEINNNSKRNINNYNYIYDPNFPYQYRNYNYPTNVNNSYDYNINETQKLLYYIIIMTLTLKSYLKRNYASKELEQSLIELSYIILKKKYSNNDLKLILYYLSRMFEILFENNNIQGYLNINDYLSKLNIITSNYDILTKEEKYPFLLTNIISLGHYFHNDLNNIILEATYKSLIMTYYVYLIIKNYKFILQNYAMYKNELIRNNTYNKNIDITNSLYDKNDLIEKNKLSENIIKENIEYNDLNKISNSIYYYFILCSQDTFTGKNIFYEFDNQLSLGIRQNNLDKEINLNKFKEACFIVLSCNIIPDENSSTMLLSFFDYICDNNKYGFYNNDIYYPMIVKLYGTFNNINNKTIIDKYSSLISRLFIIEKENCKKENLIIDRLYDFIYNLNNKQIIMKDDGNNINYENLYFFINLIKHISIYYKELKNIKIANDILIYLANFLYKIKSIYKNKGKIIHNNNYPIYENFNITIYNFDYNKDDFYTSLNDKIQISLSKFLAIYIIIVNEFFKINGNELLNKFDFCVINTITYLEINMIKNSLKKNIKIIINLLVVYINFLSKKEEIDFEDMNYNLKNSLRLIIKETGLINNTYGIFNKNFQYYTFHLKIIYNTILIILIEINKKQSNMQDLITKHNKILNTIIQYNQYLASKIFINIQQFNLKKIIKELSNEEIYPINKIIFQQVIQIIKKLLFNDEDDDDVDSDNSMALYRARNVLQKDKESEINININSYNLRNYSSKTHIFFDNYSLKDSFSQYSDYSYINNRKNFNTTPNKIYFNTLNNIDKFSDKVNLPNLNSTMSYNGQNNTDTFSEKCNTEFNLKI